MSERIAICDSKRFGFTAVELLATMSIMSVVAVTSAQVLTRMFKSSDQLRTIQHESVQMDDLARSWRTDVSSARDLRTDANEKYLCRLTSANESATVYFTEGVADSGALRLIREQAQDNGEIHRSVFYLPPTTQLNVFVKAQFGRAFATLEVKTQRDDAVKSSGHLRVDAVLNTLPARSERALASEGQP